MKIDFLLNDEDRKEVEQWIKELEDKKSLKIGETISSGGLKVTFDDEIGEDRIFVIDREIGEIVRKKSQSPKSDLPSSTQGR